MSDQLSGANRALIEREVGLSWVETVDDRVSITDPARLEKLLNAARAEGPHPDQLLAESASNPHPGESGGEFSDREKALMQLVSRWRLEASVGDMQGDDARSNTFSRVASELGELIQPWIDARLASRASPPPPKGGGDREIIDDLMQGFADPYVNKLTARAAAEIARLDAALAARSAASKGEAPTHSEACAFADQSNDPIAEMLRKADAANECGDKNGASLFIHAARLAYATQALSSTGAAPC